MKSWNDQDIKDGIHYVFQQLFRDSYGTVLVEGRGEPLYQPGLGEELHQIIFANGFWSSALHEIAHWCVAGAQRRRLVDYGYWYQPDGRDTATQEAFQAVEITPQAYEWLFTSCVGRPFYLSLDNLAGGGAVDIQGFKAKLRQKALALLADPPPRRCLAFMEGLKAQFESQDFFEAYWQRVRLGLEVPR